LSGASKAIGTALPETVYRDVGVMAADYALHRKVSPPE
jgi:hypothetical protein